MIACTHAGQYGDLLWSMATIKEIAKEHGPVDFYTTKDYGSIVELIQRQPYINEAISLEEWKVTGLVPGAQPWHHPPLPKKYENEIALGYQSWPERPLIDLHARVAGVRLTDPLPFLEIEGKGEYDIVFGISSFIEAIREPFVKQFTDIVKEVVPDLTWIDASHAPWVEFAEYVSDSVVYVGDKSGMHVIAHGLNKQAIIETEGNKDRRVPIFCNPYNDDNTYRVESPNHYGVIDLVQPFAEAAARYLNGGGLHD